jgi:hypothetical protein
MAVAKGKVLHDGKDCLEEFFDECLDAFMLVNSTSWTSRGVDGTVKEWQVKVTLDD